MKLKRWMTLTASLLLLSVVYAADIYKTVDANGNVTYSSIPPSKNAKKMSDLPGISTYSGKSAMPKETEELRSKESQPANNPEANKKSQQVRAAQKELQIAQKALEEGKAVRNGNERNYAKYQERIRQLEDNVKIKHQALQQLMP